MSSSQALFPISQQGVPRTSFMHRVRWCWDLQGRPWTHCSPWIRPPPPWRGQFQGLDFPECRPGSVPFQQYGHVGKLTPQNSSWSSFLKGAILSHEIVEGIGIIVIIIWGNMKFNRGFCVAGSLEGRDGGPRPSLFLLSCVFCSAGHVNELVPWNRPKPWLTVMQWIWSFSSDLRTLRETDREEVGGVGRGWISGS